MTLLSNRSAKAEQDPAVGGRNPRNKIEPIFQYDTISKDSTLVKLVQSITHNAHQEINRRQGQEAFRRRPSDDRPSRPSNTHPQHRPAMVPRRPRPSPK